MEKLDSLKAIEIPHRNSTESYSSHCNFTKKAGVILDRDPDLRSRLASLIQTRRGTISVNLDPAQALPPSPAEAIDPETGDGNRIAMYAIKLNEFCQKDHKSISYDDNQLTVDPPRWQVRVKVDGAALTREAKRKGTARHIASKQACESLRIDE